MRPSALLLCVAASITGGGTRPVLAASLTPPFDPMTFFDGHTRSWGVIENRSGAPTGVITTNSQGQLDATAHLRMVQHLSFQDGTSMDRTWSLWRTGPQQYEATANDMIGTAKGISDGSKFHWQWLCARSPGNPLMNVEMEQWMYQLSDGSAMIRTTVSKLGFILAEVSEHFTHPGAAE
jgi:hypothetical protein